MCRTPLADGRPTKSLRAKPWLRIFL